MWMYVSLRSIVLNIRKALMHKLSCFNASASLAVERPLPNTDEKSEGRVVELCIPTLGQLFCNLPEQ